VTVLIGALIVALLTLTGIALYREFSSADRLRDAVRESYETRSSIQSVFSLLQDAETGQRGYVITGDPRFLQPYDAARETLDERLSELGRRFIDEPEQAVDHVLLLQLTQRKWRTMEQNIDTRSRLGSQAAIALVSGGAGKAAMDDIRVVIDRMTKREAEALETFSSGAAARTRATEWLVVGLFLALVAIALGAGWLVGRYNQTRTDLLGRIQETAARQAAIFDSTLDAIITLNPSGSIETVNRAAQVIFGYREDELSRRDARMLFDLAENGDGGFLARLWATQGSLDEGVARELTGRRRDGQRFPVDVTLAAMDLPDGRHVVAVVRDITERRRIEGVKDAFVSTVSHELRTPLTSIAGSLGLLSGGAAGPLPERAQKLVGIAHANSQRLVRLINDILDMEKLEAGQLVLQLAPVDLREIAARSIDGVRGYAEGLGVALTLADGESAPVRGDEDRLIQVVTNLLSNAAKFSPRGGEVRITVDPETRIARLTVIDQGPGIPDAFRSRIFQKFAQADSSDTRAKGGTGLGLVIAREIAERHGGRLWFESAEGEGAAFHLDLPLDHEENVAPISIGRLLICEDDAAAADVLVEMLAVEGFECDVVATGREALERARSGRYVAALIDLHLPDADGISVIRALRSRPETRGLPVVAVSGDVARGKARGRSLEIVDWIEKPFDQSRIRQAIGMVLGGDGRPVVLHIDDDRDILEVTRAALADVADVTQAESLADARRLLRQLRPDLVILDLGLPDGYGLEILPDLTDETGRTIPVVVYSAQEIDGDLAPAVQAVLTKSRMSLTQLSRTVRRLSQRPIEE
jgi:PAS domain S-box-containing protein